MKELFDSWGLWWDVTIVTITVIAFIAWLEIVIGNKIRLSAKTLIGLYLSMAANWYTKKKAVTRAKARHLATGKKYHVVIIASRYFVINKYQRQKLNKILKKYHSRITIEKLLEKAVYSTK